MRSQAEGVGVCGVRGTSQDDVTVELGGEVVQPRHRAVGTSGLTLLMPSLAHVARSHEVLGGASLLLWQ
jgi:hypothetical protein